VRDYWSKNPNVVRVLSDPRLGEVSIVMMRKDQFESLEKMKNDLTRGQIIVQNQIKTLINAVAVAKTLAKKLRESMTDKSAEDALVMEQQIEVMIGVTQTMTCELCVKTSEFKLKPTPLSDVNGGKI